MTFKHEASIQGDDYRDARKAIEHARTRQETKHALRFAKELFRATLARMRLACHAGVDWAGITYESFIPFGGPKGWNRWRWLMIEEMRLANDGHTMGRGYPELVAEREAVLDREWTLSGYNRLVETGIGRAMGDEQNTPAPAVAEGVAAN